MWTRTPTTEVNNVHLFFLAFDEQQVRVLLPAIINTSLPGPPVAIVNEVLEQVTLGAERQPVVRAWLTQA